MPVACGLRVVLARYNLARAERGEGPLSLRRLAAESGVAVSVLVALHTGRSRRIDFATLDRLVTYFAGVFPIGVADLLVWEAATEADGGRPQPVAA